MTEAYDAALLQLGITGADPMSGELAAQIAMWPMPVSVIQTYCARKPWGGSGEMSGAGTKTKLSS
jgi:hypothetical protein